MKEYMKKNKTLWDELTSIHAGAEFYRLEEFKNGENRLKSIELEEVGDVTGKTLLHLQCHFGLDTLSWARLGAKVTGVDISDESIALARSLSAELDIDAEFILGNVYDLPEILDKNYDIVFMSYGVLCWLPDLKKLAEIIAGYLNTGGFFYIVESHPVLNMFEDSPDSTELKVVRSYFHQSEPVKWEPEGDYADPEAKVSHPSYEWTHSVSDIINALINAGLSIDFLHEFPKICWAQFPFAENDAAGWFRIKGDNVPLLFSIKATKIGKHFT
jgi:SAM-dependent methyltransferase